MKTYLTQHNNAEPYKVEITDNHVVVYNCQEGDYERNVPDYYQHLVTYNAIRVFIGKSPINNMTSFSGNHGDQYDGNSILIEIDNNTYVYIGHMIYSFTPKPRIVSYVSPIGNNWVPCPFAVDELNNYYLMIEDVILLHADALQKYIADGGDPYDYYYNHYKIVDCGQRYSVPKNPTRFMDITDYFIVDDDGFEQYTFIYHPNTLRNKEWQFPKNRKKDHYIGISNAKTRISLSEKMYWEIMAAFGKIMGFETLQKNNYLIND